jgi:hypothetical protein
MGLTWLIHQSGYEIITKLEHLCISITSRYSNQVVDLAKLVAHHSHSESLIAWMANASFRPGVSNRAL